MSEAFAERPAKTLQNFRFIVFTLRNSAGISISICAVAVIMTGLKCFRHSSSRRCTSR
jgi:hypothetical protein